MAAIVRKYLSACVKVIKEERGIGDAKRDIRRVVLVNRATGLMYEFANAYIYRSLPKLAFNTHCIVLRDLAFYHEWVAITRKAHQEGKWLTPEQRVCANQLALTRKEIEKLCTWCQYTAAAVAEINRSQTQKISTIPAASPVASRTTTQRIRNICAYLVWLTQDFIEGTLEVQDEQIARSIEHTRIIEDAFALYLTDPKQPLQVKALTPKQASAFRAALTSFEVFPDTPCGNRDRLLAECLDESNLRAGELLKLRCEDVRDDYVIERDTSQGGRKSAPIRKVGILNVCRLANSSDDPRIREPAVKTLPGPVQISKKLATKLIDYIRNDRRVAVERQCDDRESPFLFVCHQGKTVGHPISQRNLNRIIAKLKRVPGLEDIFPHALRHTGLTEIAEAAEADGKSDQEIRDVLIKRGHWAPESKMPTRYTQGRLERQEAEAVARRDEYLASNTKDK